MKALNFLGALFFSIPTAVVLGLIFLVAQGWATLGFATMTEAWKYVYETGWFEIIIWLLGINLIGVMIRYRIYRKFPILLLHFSLIVILIGAFITRYFGFEGTLHLRNGETKGKIVVQLSKGNPSNTKLYPLGFKIRLDKFVVKKYPGSMQPSSYDSFITVIDGKNQFPFHIYMNHILVYKGFRFYQASYDPDEKGSILSVNHDPGIYPTYLGYLLLTVGFFWSMLYPKSRFRATLNSLRKSGMFGIGVLALLLGSSNSYGFNLPFFAQNSKSVAEEWSKIVVQSRGRIEPMDTLDLDLVHKMVRKTHYLGMNYNQIVMGMVTFPEKFQKIPLIYVGHPKIRKILGIMGKYAPYNLFFTPTGDFRFTKEVDNALKTPDKDRTLLQREWLKINERVYIAFTIYTAQIFRIFPTPHSKEMNNRWFSPFGIQKAVSTGMMNPMDANVYINLFKKVVDGIATGNLSQLEQVRKTISQLQKEYSGQILPSQNRLQWEIKYNRMGIFPKLIGIYSTLGLIVILIGFWEILKGKEFLKTKFLLLIVGWLALLLHTFNMILRWYVAGHAPWSDAYESIVFIAWGSAFASLLFFRKSMLALGAGLFVAGMFMMVAHLNNIDPQITNMVPVLKSYWLLIHVAVITSSYGFLGVGAMLGILNLILFTLRKGELEKQIAQLNGVIFIAFYIGLALLSIGTFLGGVWANESWGRYWSWDPKETWSLISMVVYAIMVHLWTFSRRVVTHFYYSLLAFLSFFYILMTYFGVNFYIAQGLHSYGQGTAEGYWWINIIFAGMGGWLAVSLYLTIKGVIYTTGNRG